MLSSKREYEFMLFISDNTDVYSKVCGFLKLSNHVEVLCIELFKKWTANAICPIHFHGIIDKIVSNATQQQFIEMIFIKVIRNQDKHLER